MPSTADLTARLARLDFPRAVRERAFVPAFGRSTVTTTTSSTARARTELTGSAARGRSRETVLIGRPSVLIPRISWIGANVSACRWPARMGASPMRQPAARSTALAYGNAAGSKMQRRTDRREGNGRRPQTNRIVALHPCAADALGLEIGDCGRDDGQRQRRNPSKSVGRRFREFAISAPPCFPKKASRRLGA